MRSRLHVSRIFLKISVENAAQKSSGNFNKFALFTITSLLTISESLPFIKNSEFNGVIDGIIKLLNAK